MFYVNVNPRGMLYFNIVISRETGTVGAILLHAIGYFVNIVINP